MTHAGPPASTLGRALARMAAVASDRVRLLSLAEQGVISAANFAALLLLARGFDEAAFGLYSFAWMALLFVVNLHRSAVVVPFVIHAADPEVLAREAVLWRRLNWGTALLSALGLALAAGAVPLTGGPHWMSLAFLAAALLVGPAFAYEFGRRWLIQLDRYGATLAAALLYAAGAVLGALAAIATGRIEVAVAGLLAANGAAALLALLLAPPLPRPKARPPFRRFLAELAHFIGWLVMSNLAYNGYCHLPPLILGAIAGPVPVAVYQAMRNFIQPLATLLTAVDNFDKPRAARALAAEGPAGLKRALLHTTGALTVLTAPALALLAAFPAPLVGVVYGDRYEGAAHTLLWFAAFQAAVVAVYPLETALMVVRRADLLFRGRVVAAAAGIALSLALIPHWGVGGAMAGMIGGVIVSGLAAALQLRMTPWTRA